MKVGYMANSGDNTFISKAKSVQSWSQKLLDSAPLTDQQRQDIVAINAAAGDFIKFATDEIQSIAENAEPTVKQKARHELRNYLNIIVGFSRLIVKELPDNLLMDMVTVRKIHDTGELLRAKVDEIR